MSGQFERDPEPCRDGDHGRFEVKVRDGWARLGVLHTSTHKLNTPTLLPVVNPNIQTIPPSELWEMGFEALITNSYIIWKGEELRQTALEKGVHDFLSYPGVVMTDSGVFQQYIYGDIEIGETEVVDFQREIGVDIATMMDVFGRPDMSREELEDAVRVTAGRGPAALKAAGETMLNGPIQGGTHPDLRAESARLMSEMDFSVHPIGGIVPLMENQRYRDLVEIIVASKSELNPSRPVHLFGCGHPILFPISVALGIDLFDSAAYALFAKDGRMLSPTGTVKLAEINEWPCQTPILWGKTVDEVKKMAKDERAVLLARHNLEITIMELARCREAIRNGTIWNLVEQRSHANPFIREATMWLYDNLPDDLILNTLPFRQGGVYWSDGFESQPRAVHTEHWLDWVPPPVDHLGNPISVEDRTVVIFHSDTGPWRETIGGLAAEVVRSWPSVIPLIYTPLGLLPLQLEDLNPYSHILGPNSLWDAILPEFEEEEEIEFYISELVEDLLEIELDRIILHNNSLPEEDLFYRLRKMHGAPLADEVSKRGEVRRHHQKYAICDKITLFTGISYDTTHSIADELTFLMSRTKRVNNILLRGKHLFSQRLTDGGLSLTTDGAEWIHQIMRDDSSELGLPIIEIQGDAEPFIRDGRNVMHGFIESLTGELQVGFPCLIANSEDQLVGHGIAQCGSRDLMSFTKGIAVKVRGGVKLQDE